ncbi:MAG: YdbL family protein [candidate division KSB1 bacterium]|nr:YdbL family protein [candidate division KSB1 bacterium]MDZ7369035.1 YdbL family protein [candidate division KSB1 bacterium]MDZ7407041.1 YdbL family protein [candidate division KSB1 bacterium]
MKCHVFPAAVRLIGLSAILVFPACTIHPPEMKFTGEKTALENQILGTYNQVREDVWMVASVRAANPDSQITLSDEKRAVLTAIQNREFNKDDIDEFKRNGAVGENARGFLEIRPLPRLASDAEYRQLVEEIVAEENRDRQIIMQRIIDINSAVQATGVSEVEKVFAKLNRDNAKAGEWIQLPEGEWVRKK